MAKSVSYHEAMDTHAREFRQRKEPKKLSEIRLKFGASGGHIVEHHFESGSGIYHQPEEYPFGKDEGQKLIGHLQEHGKITLADEE
jgi:hypothetical protein